MIKNINYIGLIIGFLFFSHHIVAEDINFNNTISYASYSPYISCGGSLSAATLPFTEDWESYNGSLSDDGDIYCGTTYKWEFETSTTDGRAQWGTNAHQTNGGSGALTLVKNSDDATLDTNFAILTIDLSNYTTSTNLELEFDYVDHGDENQDNDRIWIRGSSSDNWVEAYNLAPESQTDDTYYTINSIDIDNILSNASPSQTVSSTFQVRFGQEDDHSITYDGVSFDNIKIKEISCTKPSSLSASSITHNSASLSWTETGSATTWDIEYGAEGFSQGSGTTISGTTSNPYALGSLSSNTSYDYYVRASCGGGSYSYWAGPYTFLTSCSVLSAVTLPFTEDWESYNGTMSEDGNVYCGTQYNWTFTHSLSTGRVRWGTDAFQVNTGNGAVTLDDNLNGGDDNTNYLTLTIDLSDYTSSTYLELAFDYADHQNENHHNNYVWIRGSSSEAWVQAYNLDPEAQTDNTYQSINSIDIDNILSNASPSQTVSSSFQVKFGQEDDYTTTNDGISFDNINIKENSCIKPTNLSASSITHNSASLSWTENGTATDWDIEYGAEGFSQGSGTTVTGVGSNPYTLGSLSSNTSYDYYVRASCGGGSNSYWEGPYTFLTSCAALTAVTLPFTEDWESYNGTKTENGNVYCGTNYNWTFTHSLSTGRVRWGTDTYQANTGSGAVTLDNSVDGGADNTNYLILTLDLSNYTASSYLELAFDYADHENENHNNNYIWIRGSSSDSWVQAYYLEPEAQINDTYQTIKSIDIDDILSNASPSQTVSASFQIRFGQEDNYTTLHDGISFDNIKVEERSCFTPTDLSASNYTVNSAQLSWTETGSATEWDIEYGAEGFSQGSGTTVTGVGSNPYTLGSLSSGTYYDYYVRANCGGGDVSYWEGPFTFYTLCASLSAATLPFTEDWESYNGVKMDDNIVYCGTTYNWNFETSTSDGEISWGTNAHQTNGGSGAVTLVKHTYDGNFNINYLILTIDLSNYTASSILELAFDYADHQNENHSNNYVWIRGSNTDSWVQAYYLEPEAQADDTYQTVNSIDIDNILSNASPSQTVSASFQVRFGQEDDYSITADGISFDNIKIEERSCVKPSNQSASSITHNSAIIDWTENGSSTTWDIEYGTTGFTQGSGTTISGTTTKPYTLSSLSANTYYDFYVRADCGGGTYSYWAGPYKFLTDCSLSAATLPFKERWETTNGTLVDDGTIICGSTYSWKLETSTSVGRARYGTDAYQVNQGNGAITLDKSVNGGGTYNTNYLILTLDMSNYTTSTILELAFDYADHGDEEQGPEQVWIRGSSSDAWISVYDLDPTNQADNVYQTVNGIDIDNLLSTASPSQTVSSTFQVRFGQDDDYTTLYDGISFDNIFVKFETETYTLGKTTKCSPRYVRTGSDKYFYDKYSFTVPTSENYDIEADWTGFDGYLYLYENSFDPTTPATNLLTSNDNDGGTSASKISGYALNTGTTYIVVATSNNAISSGSAKYGDMSFTITGTTSQATANAETDINGIAQSVVNSIPSTDGTSREADYECTDKDSWTHYYDDNGSTTNYSDDNLILSVKKNGNDIGTVGSGSFSVTLAGASGVSKITSATADYVNYDWYSYNRYWKLIPSSQPSTDVNVRYYYTDADFSALSDSITASGGDVPVSHTDVIFFKINSLNGTTYDVNPANGHNSVPAATAYDTDGFWIYKHNTNATDSTWKSGDYDSEHWGEYVVAHFSGGGGGASGEENSSGNPLPISLLSFYGKSMGDYNQIYWSTATEENTDYFEVERSENPNEDFISIGRTEAAGNSNTRIDYELKDLFPLENAYYRLKTVDFDGTITYSEIIFIGKEAEALTILNVYPIPTANNVTIVFSSDENAVAKFTIIDMNARLIRKESHFLIKGLNRLTYNIESFESGSYYIIIEQGNKRVFAPFIKK